jgi:protein-disulfide isomerase
MPAVSKRTRGRLGRLAGPAIALVIPVLLALGCGRTGPRAKGPVSAGARAEDANALPAFEGAGEADPGEPERFHVELGEAPTRGPAHAPVTVVMFSDFECTFCEQGYDMLVELERRYRGRVRIAYKAFPLELHSDALPAAIAARTAQAHGKFWEFHDRLFAGSGVDVDHVLAAAREAGIDPLLVARDLESLEFGPEVRRDMRQARRLGVGSTPTFFVNGRMVAGAVPIEDMSALVDNELEHAEAWLAEGVPAEKLYAHAIRDGYRRVQYTQRGRGLDPDQVVLVPIGDSPVRGPKNAPVTIVAFGDFECPFCTRGNAVVERVRARYGDKIRFVHKHSPLSFHSHAFIAARATLAAHAQGKFWQFHDELYATGAKFDEDTLLKIAKRIGLDTKKFKRAIASNAFDAAIDADIALGAALGVTGTPAYFVNGRPLEGAMPELHFRLVVEEELERAAAAVAAGTKPEAVYETLSRTPLPE